jgi:hypothetical protein
MKGKMISDTLPFVEPAGRANADGSWESSRLTRPCLRAVRYGFHASRRAAFRVPMQAKDAMKDNVWPSRRARPVVQPCLFRKAIG